MEQENLAEKLPEAVLTMEKKLIDWEKAHGPKYAPTGKREEIFSEEMVEDLKALEYIQ